MPSKPKKYSKVASRSSSFEESASPQSSSSSTPLLKKISCAGFIGWVTDAVDESNGCKILLSESSMVASSLASGSTVSAFIDELDAIVPARRDGGEELSQRMVATLLNLMDGICRTDGLLVVAAINRKPGRVNREIEIAMKARAFYLTGRLKRGFDDFRVHILDFFWL